MQQYNTEILMMLQMQMQMHMQQAQTLWAATLGGSRYDCWQVFLSAGTSMFVITL
jgi:hypothetical protein